METKSFTNKYSSFPAKMCKKYRNSLYKLNMSMNTWYLLSVVQTPPWPPSPHYHGLQPRPVSPTSGWGHQGRQHHPQIRTRIINRTAGPPPSRSSTSFTPAWPSSYPGHTSRHPQLCYVHSHWVRTPQSIRKVQWNKKILIKTFHWPSINSKKKQVRCTQRCNWFV